MFYYVQEVVEPEIETDPIIEFLDKENNDLKVKLKRSEDLYLQCLEDKMKLELKLADVVDGNEIKMDAMRLKIKKIRKYAINTEAWYHYAVGSIVTLVAIMIAFVFALKCFTQFRCVWRAICCQMRTIYVCTLVLM